MLRAAAGRASLRPPSRAAFHACAAALKVIQFNLPDIGEGIAEVSASIDGAVAVEICNTYIEGRNRNCCVSPSSGPCVAA